MAKLVRTVYLAGPINGCTDEECKDWREWMTKELRGFGILDPMRRDYRGKENESIGLIVEGDKKDIDQSDYVLVNYDKPSVGTSMEILYAWERGKRVIVVARGDSPISPWLAYHSHDVVNTFDKALSIIRKGE